MYDLTYAARGKSGIPKDTKSVAEILLDMDDVELEFVISPKNYVSRYSIGSNLNVVKDSKNINSIFYSMYRQNDLLFITKIKLFIP
jgi:hypothetical protein